MASGATAEGWEKDQAGAGAGNGREASFEETVVIHSDISRPVLRRDRPPAGGATLAVSTHGSPQHQQAGDPHYTVPQQI